MAGLGLMLLNSQCQPLRTKVGALKGAQPTGAAQLFHSQSQILCPQALDWQLSQACPRSVLPPEAQQVPM